MQQGKKSRRFRGDVITLTAGHYAANVSVVGATLVWLKFNGRDLVAERNADGNTCAGVVGVPWGSHIARGAYTFQGKEYQLPLNDNMAMHGLARFREFKILERSVNSVKLSHNLWAQPGYPFSLAITVVYSLDKATGLETKVTSRNRGEQIAPYGACGCPYILAGSEPMANWTVTLMHTLVQRNIGAHPPLIEMAHKSSLDLRAGRLIGDLKIDDAFGGLQLDGKGRWKIIVTAPCGTGVEVSAGYCCPWVILYTRDYSAPEERRKGLAIQPSTSPPQAFCTGYDLISLEPGDSHTASWRIRGLDFEQVDEDSAEENRPPEAKFPCD